MRGLGFRVEPFSRGFIGWGVGVYRAEGYRILRGTKDLPYQGARYGTFRKLGCLFWGVLIIRILLFMVLYQGPPIFGKTPHINIYIYIYIYRECIARKPEEDAFSFWV